MTREKLAERFRIHHGQVFEELRRSAIWEDLMGLLRAHCPSRLTPNVEVSSASENAEHLLGRIAGFNLAANLLDDGFNFEVEQKEPEATYDKEDE